MQTTDWRAVTVNELSFQERCTHAPIQRKVAYRQNVATFYLMRQPERKPGHWRSATEENSLHGVTLDTRWLTRTIACRSLGLSNMERFNVSMRSYLDSSDEIESLT